MPLRRRRLVLILLLAGLSACTDQPATRQPAAAPVPADLDTAALSSGRVWVDTTELPPRRADEPAPGADPARGADTLGARAAAYEPYGLRALRGLPDSETYLDTLSPRLLLLAARSGADRPILLSRAALTDTSWLALTPELDRFGEWQGHVEVAVQEGDLDGRGRPEVLVTLTTSGYGSGAGYRRSKAWLFDVTPPRPRLLLRVGTAAVDEALPGYYARHNLEFDPRDQYTGFERTVGLRRGELRLGPVRLLGRFRRQDMSAPPLPAGRYHYRGGRLRRAGQ
ncbi:hypothetical protein EJV47_24110 [Hymenobacter gummosus]|uniref:Lipoprotein n=1 Tax=Hymenobacter gummosus TaxID=1776032 RepID=A0A431TX39_9BACT|nr:hypothetical protein [Hymenobacter gummosus]RTQ45917.1 hypothetical protein EJV47_24110 [Hymenobacter gummosus]